MTHIRYDQGSPFSEEVHHAMAEGWASLQIITIYCSNRFFKAFCLTGEILVPTVFSLTIFTSRTLPRVCKHDDPHVHNSTNEH